MWNQSLSFLPFFAYQQRFCPTHGNPPPLIPNVQFLTFGTDFTCGLEGPTWYGDPTVVVVNLCMW